MKFNYLSHSNVSGFGLLDAVIGAGILAIAAYTMTDFTVMQSKALQNLRIASSRNNVVRQIEKYASQSALYEASAAFSGSNSLGNQAFKYCYSGSPSSGPACAPNCCQATTVSAPQPFYLVDPVSSEFLGGTQASSAYTGQSTTLSPARFDDFGVPCGLSNSAQCSTEVVSSFVANCGGPATCAKAQTVSLVFTVSKSTSNTSNSLALKPITRTIFNLPVADTATTSSRALPGTATAVSKGYAHTCAIVGGGVQCWGENWNGEIGQPNTVTYSDRPKKVIGLEAGVTAISAGQFHTCAIQYGKVKCWGANIFYQAGDWAGGVLFSPSLVYDTGGNPLRNATAIASGYANSCAIVNGASYCWGGNGKAVLGRYEPAGLLHDTAYGSYAEADQVNDLDRGVTAMAIGLNHACAIKNGNVLCWGLNDDRGGLFNAPGTWLLGFDNMTAGYKVASPWDLTSYPLGGPTFRIYFHPQSPAGITPGATQLAATSSTTCALVNGGFQCWGSNWGALGQGDSNVINSTSVPLDVIGLAPGSGNAQSIGPSCNGFCAVVQGVLQCWGRNSPENRLGMTTFLHPLSGASWPTPTQVSGLPGGVTNFNGGGGDESYHNCAVANGNVYCWGKNNFGQLGNGTTTDSLSPALVDQFE